MPDILGVFSKNIGTLLVEKKLSKRELARLTGLDETLIGRWMGGKTKPGLAQIGKLAEALEVPAFYLLMTAQERARWDSLDTSATLEERIARLEAKAGVSAPSTPGHGLSDVLDEDDLRQALEGSTPPRGRKRST